MTIPGVGEHSATAIVATVSNGKQFRSSRQFAAWIGLVPRQYTTGGHVQLGRISKRDDKHIRTLLIHGARAVIDAKIKRIETVSGYNNSLNVAAISEQPSL